MKIRQAYGMQIVNGSEMPKGVEHRSIYGGLDALADVNGSEMPKGVEHLYILQLHSFFYPCEWI